MKQRHVIPFVATAYLLAGAASAAPAPVRDAGDNLSNRVATLERMIQARNESQIALQQQVQELSSEVATLRGRLDEQDHQMQQMLARQRDLYQELDRQQQAASSPSSAAAEPGDTGTTVAAAPSGDEHQAYQRAVNLVLKDKRYDQAAKAFDAFIKAYPNSGYSANAYYWLGQLQFSQGELDAAKSSFTVVVDKYKDSNKRAESLFKLGVIAQNQGNGQQADVLFKRVLKEYPGTSSARLAKARLKK